MWQAAAAAARPRVSPGDGAQHPMFLSLERSDVSVSALMDGCAEDAVGLGSKIPPQRSGDHTWQRREQKDLSAAINTGGVAAKGFEGKQR